MRFPDSFLDEIRARLPASAVVGRRVKLKKQGREFAGLSPFNAEKTPSFFVNDAKGKWFDFSAGKNGDIFTFLMETEGLSFPEAVERLAGEAGVPMPARDLREEQREKERATLHDVMELATQFFEAALQSRAGAAARGYLNGRDIGPDLQRRFRIGYAPPDRAALKEHLAGKGIPQDQMIAAGLLVSGDDIPVSFDRFRDRVIFPITDFRGRIVAFGGRALSADVPAKYLNSPETELFHKGSLLYNGADARHAAHDAGTVIAVEGYVDVIRMVAAGFAHTVAPLGTALTERQLQILWRMADEPILCFDGDKAGMRAAHRAADLALPLLQPGKSLRFALLPPGQDPDDLIRAAGARRHAGDHRRRPAAGRAGVEPRDRCRRLRHAGAPRRAGGAPPRDRPHHRRRERAPPLRPGLRRAHRRLLPGRRAAAARMARRPNAGASAAGPSPAVPQPGAVAADPGLRSPAPQPDARRPRDASASARSCW